MYIRSLRKPSANKNIFKFASTKINKTIMCESTIEFDACFHHEYNNDIESFESQPKGFFYEFEGCKRPYTPDCLIKYTDNTFQYQEYKPLNKTLGQTFKAEFLEKQKASTALGIELILVTNKQIRVEPVLNNLKLLHRYSGICQPNDTHIELVKTIKSLGKVSLRDIPLTNIYGEGKMRAFLCLLIGKGLLEANLTTECLKKPYCLELICLIASKMNSIN